MHRGWMLQLKPAIMVGQAKTGILGGVIWRLVVVPGGPGTAPPIGSSVSTELMGALVVDLGVLTQATQGMAGAWTSPELKFNRQIGSLT
jgi:hypothetical protein